MLIPQIDTNCLQRRIGLESQHWFASCNRKGYPMTLTLHAAAAIALTVLGLNLMGDGLRDILDPRLARRS